MESVRVAFVHVRCEAGIEAARMECHLDGQPIDDYENGEWLEARSYVKDKRLVMLGTEDGDVVYHRIPLLLAPHDEPFALVAPHEDKIRTDLRTRGLLNDLSLHVAIAENPYPEPKALAARDAVNVSHNDLIERHGLPLDRL